MINFENAISAIRDNNGFKPNKREDSYYRIYITQDSKPIQIRISNHGTHLQTWLDKNYDPSNAINICIIFSENGSCISDTNVDMRIMDKDGHNVGQRKNFEVVQYVYNCQNLNVNEARLINQSIKNIWQNKGFIDPLSDEVNHAIIYKLQPNSQIQIIEENARLHKALSLMKRIDNL